MYSNITHPRLPDYKLALPSSGVRLLPMYMCIYIYGYMNTEKRDAGSTTSIAPSSRLPASVRATVAIKRRLREISHR